MTDVLLDIDGPICIVTMNRPKVFNALSEGMCVELAAAWDRINEDDTIRVAVLTGAGNNFSAGGDLKQMLGFADDRSDDRTYFEKMGFMFKAMLRNFVLHKPLIAAVEGAAIAGGTEILQATDIRIAGQSAKFGLPEVTLGLFPLAGSTARLARQMSFTKAMELLLTGSLITAPEAREFGLIGSVVPDGTALEKALIIAERIARNGPLAVRAIKRSVRLTAGLSEEAALAVELEVGRDIWETQDAIEGMRAFSERRPPSFTGK